MTQTLYDRLQVSSSATTAEIKKAYKKLSQKHHPDKGGDPDYFVLIQEAYDTLKFDDLREEYDDNGMQPKYGLDQMAERRISDLFENLIQAADVQGNIVDRFREAVQSSTEQYERLRQEIQYRHQIAANKRDRVSTKEGVKNLFRDLVEKRIASCQAEEAQANQNIQINNKVLEMLKDYSDASPTQRSGQVTFGGRKV